MEKTVIVMPVANEEESMEQVLEGILGLPYDSLYLYVVMDGYSRDRTADIVKEYEKKTEGKIRYIYHEKSYGVISCYLEGFRRALEDGAGWIIEMDGGGSHLPSQVPEFIEKLEQGYECVWGSRFIKGGKVTDDPVYRRMLSKGGTVLANLVLGTRLQDMTSGFEGFQRNVLEEMKLGEFLSRGHMYQTEMRYYCRDKKAVEVPIHYRGSKSGLHAGSVTEALRILFRLKEHEKNIKNTGNT
ncbi:MAG: glycosyltransferase [Lachnospiraceae bacterium]|nr:glycosyltransferase [Lachnospiraceae bacterium]